MENDIEIFSPEERNEINKRIEAASARNAVAVPGLPSKKEASRRGLFPLLVNVGAVVLLAAGIFLLFSFQQSDEAEIRESGAVLGLTERALIREIRNSQSSNREEITAAREELEKLSGDAEKAVFIEKQLSGFYVHVTRQIEAGRYNEAADSIEAMKEFIDTPSFFSIKQIQARRESDTAALNALSALIAEAQKSNGAAVVPEIPVLPAVPPGSGAEAALRQQLLTQTAAMEELQKNTKDLQERNAAVSQTVAEQTKQLESLRAQNASYAQQIEILQRTIASVNSALQNQP